jgi:hypothetical protein
MTWQGESRELTTGSNLQVMLEQDCGLFLLRAGTARRLGRTTSARTGERRLVTQTFASWNQIGEWLRRLSALRQAA